MKAFDKCFLNLKIIEERFLGKYSKGKQLEITTKLAMFINKASTLIQNVKVFKSLFY